MLIDNYFSRVDALLEQVRTTQREAMLAAGRAMADTMQNGGSVHIHDTGHIINFELISRSGGLVAPKSLIYYLHTDNDGRKRDSLDSKERSMEGLAELVIRASNICPGDLLIIGSVSGRSEQVVDLAITAKEYGCKIVALTSLEYSSGVKSAHSSGKRLFEVADIVIDNCAPIGDGMLHVDGIEMPFIPASGLSATYIMWTVYAACAEELLARGISPSVYKSSNLPGGDDYNLEMDHRWEKLGY